MKNWRIVEVPEGEAVLPSDLTSSELFGVSVLLTHQCGEPYDDSNVYFRARNKIQPQVRIAMDDC